MTTRYCVRIDRSDGSRTYKGTWSLSHCEREANAWRSEFPDYVVTVLLALDARDDMRTWSRVTRGTIAAQRYYPSSEDDDEESER